MFKSNRHSASAKHNSSCSDNKLEADKQKQKKRLSFKDPEVEKTRPSNAFPRSSDFLRLPNDSGFLRGRTPSLEDLTLEDQALLIAKSVGSAFVKPSRDQQQLTEYGRPQQEKTMPGKDFDRETTQREVPFEESRTACRQSTKCVGKTNDCEYLDDFSPAKLEPAAMRCPVIEFAGEERASPSKNLGMNAEAMPTSARHQIQLLNYQLEQQRQQTQTAMYQIQLLKDQLEAESSARYKAQVHNHHLMMQNKELLDHIQKLFQQVQDLEKKIEKLESNFPAQDPRQVQPPFGAFAANQQMYRRNSASTQSLWSTSNLLNPAHSTMMNRRGSATNITLQQEPKEIATSPAPADNGRRFSVKDDPLPRYSGSFDTDWRFRRRGSSTNYSAIDFARNRVGEHCLSDAQNAPLADAAAKNVNAQLSIPENKSTSMMMNAKRNEPVSGLEKPNRKTCVVDGTLVIQDSSTNDYVSPSVGGAASTSVSGATKTESSSNSPSTSKKQNGLINRQLSTLSIQESPKRSALGSLRLFNS